MHPFALIIGLTCFLISACVNEIESIPKEQIFHVDTFAGLATGPGLIDAIGNEARFRRPAAIAEDMDNLYIAELWNCTLRKMEKKSRAVTTIAGSARRCTIEDGQGTKSSIQSPTAMTIHNDIIYMINGTTIREFDLNNKWLRTIAGKKNSPGAIDGSFTAALFNFPIGIAFSDGHLFVADTLNSTIRKIDLLTQEVTTFAGVAGEKGLDDGIGNEARFIDPSDIVIQNGFLYVVDHYGNSIRKIELNTAQVETLDDPWKLIFPNTVGKAGSLPNRIAIYENYLFVADRARTIRQVSLNDFSVTPLAGSAGSFGFRDGIGENATFRSIEGMITDGTSLYLTDSLNHSIRQLDIASGKVNTIAGIGPLHKDGAGLEARFDQPMDVTIVDEYAYVTDKNNSVIRKISLLTGNVSTFAGKPKTKGVDDGNRELARFTQPEWITSNGTHLYVTDLSTIRKIDIATGFVTTVAGTNCTFEPRDGIGVDACFQSLQGITHDDTHLYVTEQPSGTIRKISIETGMVTTIAGSVDKNISQDGIGIDAGFRFPLGIVYTNKQLYVAEKNKIIRKINLLTNEVSTIAGRNNDYGFVDGPANQARLLAPKGLATDGHMLFVSDLHTLRTISLNDYSVHTLAGGPLNNYKDGVADHASFNTPYGMAIHKNILYIADTNNHVIRRLNLN